MQKNKGFTLLVAILTTSMLLLVSFMVANLAFKQLVISYANEESQQAFYAADSGVECAVYQDLNTSVSQFATSTPGSITCNGQSAITTGSQTNIPATPSTSRIGGGGDANPTSIFYLTFAKGCAVVQVTKVYSGPILTTTINSKGYNTCNTSALRRYERGVTLSYTTLN